MTRTKVLAAYEAGNLQAAVIIAGEADLYGGEEALAVQWARKILSKQGGLNAGSDTKESGR